MEQRVADIKQGILHCEQLQERINQFDDDASKFLNELLPILKAVNIPEHLYPNFRPRFGNNVFELIKAARQNFLDTEREVQGSAETDQDTLTEARFQLATLTAKISQNQAIREQLKNLQTQLTKLETSVLQQKQEIETIELSEAQQIKDIKEKLRSCYLLAFDSLVKERQVLEQLYEPVRASLSSTAELEKMLDFSIRWRISLDAWVAGYETKVDSRRALPLGIDDLREYAKNFLQPAWLSQEPAQIGDALNRLMSDLKAEAKSVDYLKKSVSTEEFLRWVYDFDHVTLEYGLKYNETDLENLSPGTKGIVLLILYLIMDKDDTRPLIIDQPEENLDNESIYDLLVPQIRKTKTGRQIILVSHNPNLVVNTDAEQVIVASCARIDRLPRISYQSGALEDAHPDGIRDRICATLEGGKDAFLRREQRYELQA